MIDLHFTPTPNGQKITIALEELALDYRVIGYDNFAGAHLTAEFGRIIRTTSCRPNDNPSSAGHGAR